MTTPVFSLKQLDAVYKIERDWLFEKILGKLNMHRHLILTADQGWGIREYVNELGFQLAEKNPDIHVCHMDIKPAHSMISFLELFVAALSHRFPEATSQMKIDSRSMDTLTLPAFIAQRNKIRVAVFLANSHLFHRFKDPVPFLRMLKQKLRNQRNCIFCLYGINTPDFRDLVQDPGPLSGLGQLCVVDNHPFYLKLLVWHALIRTGNICTKAIVEEALNDLIHHFDYRFNKIAENLTPKQLSFLRALVEGNQKVYSKATREEYQLGSTSNVARPKQSLERKELICTWNRESVCTDPIFMEWLRRNYFDRN